MKSTTWVAWTNQEIALLHEVWLEPVPLKSLMHLFPRHTHKAVMERGVAEKLPRRRTGRFVAYEESYAAKLIREALTAKPGDSFGIAARTGLSRRTVHNFMSTHRAQMHVSGWLPGAKGGVPAAVYAWGEGFDVPKPIGRKASARLLRKKLTAIRAQGSGHFASLAVQVAP